jgi:TonB family protein
LDVPAYRCEGGGEVVVRITVNPAGDVTAASILSGGDECMRSTALQSARKSRFDINNSAPTRQNGTITYIFIPQ